TTRRTSSPVTDLAMTNARHSRVYSSTSDKHLSHPPPQVRSRIRSQVQTSFLNRAGRFTQLLALDPSFVRDFPAFFRRRGRRNPIWIHSRRTRFRLTRQPARFSNA